MSVFYQLSYIFVKGLRYRALHNFTFSRLETKVEFAKTIQNGSSMDRLTKRGFDKLQDGSPVQRYQCKDCCNRFNERTGPPVARLRASSTSVSYPINAR